MTEIKVGFVGLGQRGASFGMEGESFGLLGNVLNKKDAVVTAICDKFQERLDAAEKKFSDKGLPKPLKTTDFNQVINSGVDVVIVCTSWANHVKVALASMEQGVPVAMEVGGTHSIEDCWKLVDCYEKTKTPFMFLENCCFNKNEMLVTSLVRNGVLGDISYCQGYYCHDLREEIVGGIDTHHYRLGEYRDYNCENYPTHELGPIAKILNINSGNRFTKLVSMSSKSQGLHQYIMDNPKYTERLKDVDFKQGDVTTTMIQCENGETIFIKLDTCLPRLYDRNFTVSGTKGFFCGTTKCVITEGKYDTEKTLYRNVFFNDEEYRDYLPDEWKNITEEQIKAGHGGMDYIMLSRFLDCVKYKKPMPVDVYDAVSWMSVTALSEQSIKGGSIPVECPDFTRGKYKDRKTVDVLDLPIINNK